ncbi:unnamed protein product [Brachionus calyciflorus]|uniref:V-type proton ATPase subunit n=1 Tax=Brachionus calyciflorus TaxID=104777 RepID=A0A813WST7_9BILA|nr:unnamed protein product [Brachionus calyciflorus]
MESIGIPFLIVSLFWFIIGGILPFFAKGPNRELIRVMLILTSVSCYMFWLCTILHQYHPLIGPQLNNETAKALQLLWGNF